MFDDDEGVTFAGLILQICKQHQVKLLHDYYQAGYFLSPHPGILKHSVENMSIKDKKAIEKLLR